MARTARRVPPKLAKTPAAATQPLKPVAQELPRYLEQSRQPLSSLIFIAPPLLLYELGVLYWAQPGSRNGADIWLRDCLQSVGVSQVYLLPWITGLALLAWHFLMRGSWRWSPGILCSMWVECLALAAALVVVAEAQGAVVQSITGEARGVVRLQTGEPTAGSLVVAYLGAGIYEETLFRLLCLPLLWAAGWGLGMSKGWSLAVAVVAASCLFSGAHHFGPHGEAFSWYCFGFRAAAGLCFAMIFLFRGFGIAAGTHALYDVLVVFV